MTERRKGPAPAARALLPTLLLAAAASSAQQVIIEQCREQDSDDARIACLERALAGREASTGPATEETPAPDPEPRPEPEPMAPPPSPMAVERTVTEPAHSDIGAEQVRARSETAAGREARLASAAGLKVAAYGEVPYQRLTVELENGQVWQQIKGDTQHVRVDLDRNQTVDIEESTLGGYKLRLNEIRRTIRVERIR